jgi:hypothetical protein
MYNNSLCKALQTIYPEHKWEMWKFKQSPKHYWDDIKNQRIFFDSVAKKLGIEKMEDWYTVKNRDVRDLKVDGVLSRYRGSLIRALKSIYPEYEWKEWRFFRTTHHFWKDESNALSFMKDLEKVHTRARLY